MKHFALIASLLLLLACQHSGSSGKLEDQALACVKAGEQSWQAGENEQADAQFRKALSLTRDPNLKTSALLKLCLLNSNTPALLSKLEHSLSGTSNQQTKVNALIVLSEYYRSKGDTVRWNQAQASLNSLLSEWVVERLNQDKAQQQTPASGFGLIESLLTVVIVLLCGLVFVIYKRSKKQEQTLADALDNITTLRLMADNLENTRNELRKLALQHFDIHKKVALLNGMLGEAKDGQEKKILTLFNQAVYGNKKSFNWEDFQASLDVVKGGKLSNLRTRYPQLTETEYRILILSFTGLSNKESSIVLNLSTNTINAHRSSIRRKLGIPDYGDFESHVLNS